MFAAVSKHVRTNKKDVVSIHSVHTQRSSGGLWLWNAVHNAHHNAASVEAGRGADSIWCRRFRIRSSEADLDPHRRRRFGKFSEYHGLSSVRIIHNNQIHAHNDKPRKPLSLYDFRCERFLFRGKLRILVGSEVWIKLGKSFFEKQGITLCKLYIVKQAG